MSGQDQSTDNAWPNNVITSRNRKQAVMLTGQWFTYLEASLEPPLELVLSAEVPLEHV